MSKSTVSFRLLSLVAASAVLVRAEPHGYFGPYGLDDGTFPHAYPGIPTGDFGPNWQDYFQVTEHLTNVTFDLGRNWAGNIPVNRPGHPNNTLFFWAFEKENGSLTAAAGERNDEPWGIYANGAGPSSMFGLAFDNGPIRIGDDYSVQKNNFSWHNVADWIWVDISVGVGFATAETGAQANDDDQTAEDLIGFLENLVKVFPSLKTRPLYFAGSGDGFTPVAYFAKQYFGLVDPPVNLRKIAAGNPAIQIWATNAAIASAIATYPQLIGYNIDVYNYFKRRVHDCGYDLNLTYPSTAKLPPLLYGPPPPANVTDFEPLQGLFPCPDLLDELTIYTPQSSLPWNVSDNIDVYNIRDALGPMPNMDGSVFFNDDAVRAALHAPTSKNWTWYTNLYYGTIGNFGDPSPPPAVFLDELAANATKHNVGFVLWNGNDNLISRPFETEFSIQNTTFGGIQGFTRKPATPWVDDDGEFAGIVHQERNWTYVLVKDASNFVTRSSRGRALTLVREFVVGNNQTGLVTNVNGQVSVIGGEDDTIYANGILPGQEGIFMGNAQTKELFTYPTATIEAWKSFTATAFATPTPTAA